MRRYGFTLRRQMMADIHLRPAIQGQFLLCSGIKQLMILHLIRNILVQNIVSMRMKNTILQYLIVQRLKRTLIFV